MMSDGMLAAVSLGLGDYAVFGGMLAAFGGIMTTVMLGNIKALATRIGRAESQIDRVDDRVAKVEQDKVAHADWVRVVASQHNRQDHISRQLAELGGRVDAAIGVSAGLQRIAKAVEQGK